MLRHLIVLSIVLASAAAGAESFQSRSRFGLGLEVGAPTGLNGKYFTGGSFAVQGGIGILESWGDDGLHLHAEAVWHPAVLHRGRTVDIPLHVGVGGRFLQHDWGRYDYCYDDRGRSYRCNDTHVGIRAPIGISFLFKRTPMDLFLELALVIDVIHVNNDYMYDHDHAALHGALGGRFYF